MGWVITTIMVKTFVVWIALQGGPWLEINKGEDMKYNYPKIAEHLGVRLRGDETFTELLEIEKQVKEYKERKQRIAEENANIQRVDAQVKGVKKW